MVLVQLLSGLLAAHEPPPLGEKQRLGEDLRAEFIRKTATEVAFTTLCTGLACYFSTSHQLRLEFLKKAVTTLIATTIARAIATGCRYAAVVDQGYFFRTISVAADFVAPYLFTKGLTICLLNPLIHETGHLLTAYVLFRGNKVQIVAESMQKWNTNCIFTRGYSYLGDKLGAHTSKMIYQGGGTLVSGIASQVALVFYLRFSSSYADLAKYSLCHAGFALWGEFSYARAAQTATEGNDFLVLWKEGGLHPRVAMASIAITPVVSIALSVLVRKYF